MSDLKFNFVKAAEDISKPMFLKNPTTSNKVMNEYYVSSWANEKLGKLIGPKERMSGWIIDPIYHHVIIRETDETIIMDDEFFRYKNFVGQLPSDVIIDICESKVILDSSNIKSIEDIPVRMAGSGVIEFVRWGTIPNEEIENYKKRQGITHVKNNY